MKVLQTSALPLGYAASFDSFIIIYFYASGKSLLALGQAKFCSRFSWHFTPVRLYPLYTEIIKADLGG